MKRCTLLLLATFMLAGCRGGAPPLQDPALVAQGTSTFSDPAFSFTYPATWRASPGQREDEVVTLSRSAGFGLLVVQHYQGSGSLLELQRYEESQAEGTIDASENGTLGGIPSFRIQTATQLDGRTLTLVSAGAIHGGRGFYVGYYYDPADPAMSETVSELEDVLASWTWN